MSFKQIADELNICQNNVLLFIQEWLDRHGPYDFIVDGANIGLYQWNFVDGGFSVSQVSEKVVGLYPFLYLHHTSWICMSFRFSWVWKDISLLLIYLTRNASLKFYYLCNLFISLQLCSVVNVLRQRSSKKKWPLILLHNKRATGVLADNPYNKQLIEDWRKAGSLYTTPNGSNDDW